jgi:hypothetical protein
MRSTNLLLALLAGAAQAQDIPDPAGPLACFGGGTSYREDVLCVSSAEILQVGGDVRYAPLLSADTRRPIRRESAALVNCQTRRIYILADRGQIDSERTFAEGVGAYICKFRGKR